MAEFNYVSAVMAKYPYLTQSDAQQIVDKAKMFYYGLRYPCRVIEAEDTLVISGFFAQNWVLSACDEIIERLGFSSAVAYHENGVGWTFDNAELSGKLISLVKPIVGTIN